MAAEILVDLAKEDKLVKQTLLKIGKYIARHRNGQTINAGETIVVANKTITLGRLSWCHPEDAFVFCIPYELSAEEWESWAKYSYLKCHCAEDGNLNRVYNLL